MADKKGGPSCDGCGSPSCEVSYSTKNYCGDCYRKKINKQPLPKEMKKKPPAPKSATLCNYEDLVRHGRILGRIGWRHVAVFCVRGDLFAVDALCYHAGGPLIDGDIEDIGDRVCVRCPWHSYRIDLKTGDGILVDRSSRFLEAKGKRQRTHHVEVVNGDVVVTLNLEGERLSSDDYC